MVSTGGKIKQLMDQSSSTSVFVDTGNVQLHCYMILFGHIKKMKTEMSSNWRFIQTMKCCID
jgi:hypothetical protein